MLFPLMAFPLKVFHLIVARRWTYDSSLIDRLTINYFDITLQSAAMESGLYLKTLHSIRRLDIRHCHVANGCRARTKATSVNQPVEVRCWPNGEEFYPAIV
jgi:hypothetical protein